MTNIDRKLATIREVSNIIPINGADNIELAVIDGWQCVVKKDEFAVGSKAVYFEIDSFLPVREEFEFLRKSSFKSHPELGDGFRVKTIKLRGEISQGLLLPISMFNCDIDKEIDILNEHPVIYCERIEDLFVRRIGTDLTNVLNVKKWESPLSGKVISGNAKGNFPSFIPKTDQERVQNYFNTINTLPKDTTFEVTMKLDGSSMTVYYVNGQLGVCSRNLDLKLDDESSKFVRVATKNGILDALKNYGVNLAIQGELMGEGVQKNREQIKGHEFYVFDIYNIDECRYLKPEERKEVFNELSKTCNIKHIPIIDNKMKIEVFKDINDFLKYADIPSIQHKIAEGVVFKANEPVYVKTTNNWNNELRERIIEYPNFTFKVINNNYLLKCED